MKSLKLISSLAAAVMTVSAMSSTAFADEYPDGEDGYGYSMLATVRPVLTLDIDGLGNEAVYDSTWDIAGKIVTVALDVSGANMQYASTGIHVYYDDRLKIVPNYKGWVASSGYAIQGLYYNGPEVDSAAPEGFDGFFLTTAGVGNHGSDGTMWTFELKIPEDAMPGDVFPIDIVYRKTGHSKDLFINTPIDMDGYNMQAYAFTYGIYNAQFNPNPFSSSMNVAKVPALHVIDPSVDAYIAVAGSPIVEPTTTTTTATSAPTNASVYGDANNDGRLSVADAVTILQFIGNRDKYPLSEQGKINADVDGYAGITGKDALTIQYVDAGLIKADALPLDTPV